MICIRPKDDLEGRTDFKLTLNYNRKRMSAL